MGEQLRRLQEQLKMSQLEFAEELNITQGTLSKYIRDISPVPFQLAIHISKKYNRPDFFIAWSGELQRQGMTEILVAM